MEDKNTSLEPVGAYQLLGFLLGFGSEAGLETDLETGLEAGLEAGRLSCREVLAAATFSS